MNDEINPLAEGILSWSFGFFQWAGPTFWDLCLGTVACIFAFHEPF